MCIIYTNYTLVKEDQIQMIVNWRRIGSITLSLLWRAALALALAMGSWYCYHIRLFSHNFHIVNAIIMGILVLGSVPAIFSDCYLFLRIPLGILWRYVALILIGIGSWYLRYLGIISFDVSIILSSILGSLIGTSAIQLFV